MGIEHYSYPSPTGDMPLTIQTVDATCRCGNRVVVPVPSGMTEYKAQADYMERLLRDFAAFCKEQTGKDLLRAWNLTLALRIYEQAQVELLCREVESDGEGGEQ